MKRCPKCSAEYADESLNFCLEDGESLIEFTGSETQTKILDSESGASLKNRRNYVGSIAVMPFADWSNEPDNQHFCDGLAEDILNALTAIDDLKVASCTASFYFKGKDATAAEMGRHLASRRYSTAASAGPAIDCGSRCSSSGSPMGFRSGPSNTTAS